MLDEQKPTIFVVDDEPLIARTLATILFGFGYTATAFTNPLDALYAAESACPDFLLSDVFMPHLNGIDLRITFCERCPKCKVLLISGQIETSDLLESAREAGHNFTIVAKPIHPTELLAAIKALSPRGEQY